MSGISGMKTINKYLIALGIGFALTAWVVLGNDIFNQTDMADILQILADGFTLPAVLLLGSGGLVFASNEGTFDSLVYGVRSFMDMFRKERKNEFKSFYDYKESKAEKRMSFGFLLISGLIFAVLTAITLVLYTKYI